MKSLIRNRMAVAAIVVALAICLVSITGALAATSEGNSGIAGLQGPTFTFGFVRLASNVGENQPSGAAADFYNCAPFSITGFALSKTSGALHVWLSSGSEAVQQLGFKEGDIVVVYCSNTQVQNINSGDFVQIAGFTVRGQLVYAYQAVLPAPFSY